MKSLLSLCVIICIVSHGINAFDYIGLSSPLRLLAAKKGFDVHTFANKTVYEIAKSAIPIRPMQTLRDNFRAPISPSLESLFKRKSLFEVYNSFKGFGEQTPSAYNVSLLQFVHMAAAFDSQGYTANVMNSISYLVGNASIGPYLKTTDAKLRQRNYLSDLYPVLASNVANIMDQTKSTFFLKSLKISEVNYRSIVKNDTAVDALLGARKRMATAVVSGSQSSISAASREFQEALTSTLKGLLSIASKALAMQGMQLYEARTRCNISMDELKMKSLLQVSLKCSGAPENLPIMQYIPKGGFPKELYTMKIADLARKMNVPFNDLLQYTVDMILVKYMKTKKSVSFVDDPLYHVARQKGRYIVDIANKTLYELAALLSGLNGTMLESKLNASAAVLNEMKNVTLKMLPSKVKAAISMEFPLEHFYFLPLSSIITILDKKNSVQTQAVASENIMLFVDEGSNNDAARILGFTKTQMKRTPLLILISKITGKSERIISENLSLSPMQRSKLKTLDLETAEELHKTFGVGDLKLDRQSLQVIVKNHLYTILLITMKEYFRVKNGSLDLKLLDIFRNDPISHLIKLTGKKMGIKDGIMSTITLNELRTALGKSPDDMRNQTLFAVLRDMRELSKSKIPNPDYYVTIRKLGMNKGVLISSFAGKSLLDIFKSVTNSTWQIPMIIKSLKGNPNLEMALKNTSRELNMVLNNTIKNYKSYNITIRELMKALIRLDDKSNTKVALRELSGFLATQLGVTSLSSIGINMKDMRTKPFLTYALPVLSKSLQVLRSDIYVKKYFKVHKITPEMLELLKSKADGDIGQKLVAAATDLVIMDHQKTMNTLFQLKTVIREYGKRFAKKPFKDIMKACRITKEILVSSSIKDLFQSCLNMTSVAEMKNSLDVTTFIRPFSLDMPLEELGRILDMHTDQMDNSISSFVNEKTQKDVGALFTPLKDVFKAEGISMATGTNMTLISLFKRPLFSRFNRVGYLMRSMIFGNNLKIIKEKSVGDLVKANGIDDKSLSKTTPYSLLKQSISLLKTDPDVCNKLSRMSRLCHKHASCFPIGKSFNCRCEGGYDGDGFKNCSDKCKTISCKKGTTCVTLPGKGAVCKCNNRWEKYVNGKCQRVKGVMIKVTKLKLKQEYKKEYANVNSIAFKNKASEIEATLFDSICKKIGCVAVVVTSIKQGSLVVDFDVIFSSRNVSASVVQATVNDAMKSPAMAALRPDAKAKPQASQSDACQSGMAKCGVNEECIPSEDGYTCSCISGYEKKDDECKKSGGLSFVVIIIIIIVAFVLIVTLIVIVIWRWRRGRSSSSNKYAMAYLTNNENETVQLTGGEYAFSYGGEKAGAPPGQDEPA